MNATACSECRIEKKDIHDERAVRAGGDESSFTIVFVNRVTYAGCIEYLELAYRCRCSIDNISIARSFIDTRLLLCYSL